MNLSCEESPSVLYELAVCQKYMFCAIFYKDLTHLLYHFFSWVTTAMSFGETKAISLPLKQLLIFYLRQIYIFKDGMRISFRVLNCLVISTYGREGAYTFHNLFSVR